MEGGIDQIGEASGSRMQKGGANLNCSDHNAACSVQKKGSSFAGKRLRRAVFAKIGCNQKQKQEKAKIIPLMILRQLKRQHGFQNTFINQKAGNHAAKCLLRNLIDCSRKKRGKQLHHNKRRDKPVMSHHNRKHIAGKLPDALSG